ncbi:MULTISPECIES: SMI1/KNR4 family protein [unclassified Streptomyces]|uniref:SMI1/KNR4 family protein n=1 Tax=unclassified Streptomyces TaxID=2593676 RepID=UPI001CBDA2B3|nr:MULTISPECIES: SMI1/KNR4 family protein [unclassified Streptomyces]WPO71646.1 SMI1/KNR4 family protein [Streptomyces sp. KN37]
MGGVWTGVRERVLALRSAPYRKAVFGAEFHEYGHGFALLPVLTREQVAAVERHRGVAFPAEYRGFLLEVGAGGAGPDYGLFPVRPVGPDTPPATPHGARPFRPERTRELADHQDAEPSRAAYGGTPQDEARFRRDHHAWDRREDELLEILTEGTLCVGEQGCGYYTLLALTGPERGTMWHDARAAAEGVVPVQFVGRPGRVTFAAWYLHWLNRAERQATRSPGITHATP